MQRTAGDIHPTPGAVPYLRCMFLRSICLCLCTALSVSGWSQSGEIFLQTENNQPFSVTRDGSSYSSSSTGTLMIRDAGNGSQVLRISFAGDEGEAFIFRLEAGEGPRAYSLRLGVDNRWSLFDMINFQLLTGETMITAPTPVQPDRIAVVPVRQQLTMDKPEQAVVPWYKKPAEIRKIFDKAGTEGIDQVYIIVGETRTDTIALFIPVLEAPAGPSTGNPSGMVAGAGVAQSCAWIRNRKFSIHN